MTWTYHILVIVSKNDTSVHMEDSNFAQRGSFPLGVGVQNLITSST